MPIFSIFLAACSIHLSWKGLRSLKPRRLSRYGCGTVTSQYRTLAELSDEIYNVEGRGILVKLEEGKTLNIETE